jgi:6-pyruvoyltetrahydropterin/6-carboxytetrahydropterin synthase
MDFGALDAFKSWAEYMFDHTLVIAEDDPHLETFKQLNTIGGGFDNLGVCDLRIVPAVGCERFSELAYNKMSELISKQQLSYPVNATVRVKSVEVFEHGANSAVYEG